MTQTTPFRVPAAEIRRRLQCIRRRMATAGIDALLVLQRVDLFYFSGTAQSGCLYLPLEGEPLLCVKRYPPRARQEAPAVRVVPIASMREVPDRIVDGYGRLPAVLGFELDVLPVNDFRFYRKLFNGCACVDASALILDVRAIKSGWEIAQMERTAEMSARVFDYMRAVIRPGLTEMEFAGLCETHARKLGHGGRLRTRHYLDEAYPWHVLSGKSGGRVGLLDSPASGDGTSAAFPCGAGNRTLALNEPVMVDFGSVKNGYHMDETRMFAIGSMPEAARAASRAAMTIYDAVLDAARPGVRMGELFDIAAQQAAGLGFADYYLGPPGWKVRFVGHGIGLELVEPPFIAAGKNETLVAGMTFALEPKFCYPDAFAAGIESVFVVTENGCRQISRIPADIFIC